MTIKAVIGLGFGDEGKGLVTNSLCHQHSDATVIRFSGGQQAGHTVHTTDAQSHVFSNFGSGSFVGCPTYWSEFCTIDPAGILKEHSILKNKNVNPILFINTNCPVTTPYDKCSYNFKHGTCGVGVGSTWQREKDHYSLLAGDLQFPEIVKIKAELIRKYYGQKPSETILNTFLSQVRTLVQLPDIYLCDSPPAQLLNPIFICEGSQGLLLDQNIGFFPHVTRSNTGSKNILTMDKDPEYYLVTRAYQTRHGPGPMTNEEYGKLSLKNNENETNKFHEYQGVFRTSILDLSLLKYAITRDEGIRNSSKKTLIITCCDQILGPYKFMYDGQFYTANSAKKFGEMVGTKLGIANVYTVHGADEIINFNH